MGEMLRPLLKKMKTFGSWRIYRARLLLHRIFRFIPHPNQQEALRYEIEKADDENINSRPVPGDEATFNRVWTVDFYTPSAVPELKKNLSRLGLDKNDLFPGRNREAWLRSAREQTRGRGWASLGFIKRKGDKRLFSDAIVGPLPDFAEFAQIKLMNIAPSVTALVVQFRLRPALESKFYEIANQTLVPKFESFGRSYSTYGPEELKRKAMADYRLQVRREIRKWFNLHLPGLLSTSEATRMPVCELLFLMSPESQAVSPLQELLEIDHDFHRYRSGKWPGVSLIWPFSRELDNFWHAALCADRKIIREMDMKAFGKDDDGYAHVFSYGMEDFVAKWGLFSALRELEARLSRLRDAELGLAKQNASKALKQLRAMTVESADVASISRDFCHLDKKLSNGDEAIFLQKPFAGKGKDFNLTKHLQILIIERAQELGKFDASLKALAMQSGNLLLASANLKLQSKVWYLTIVTGLLALIAAIKPAQEVWCEARPAVMETIHHYLPTKAGLAETPLPCNSVK